jgi:uncharacterized membrane protein
MQTRLSRFLFLLFCLFCVAYPIAVIGVAFDIHPPFSMTWAGSALLILEGTMLTVALMDVYGPRGLLSALFIALFSYGIEALGVRTGFPFGSYRYTDVLAPILPGGVPLAVIFVWLMIMIAVRGIIFSPMTRVSGYITILLASSLATLLDLELEPVAFHLEKYWIWLAPGSINYYGVPLFNFIAWFIITFVLLTLVSMFISKTIAFMDITSFSSRLPTLVPPLLYSANILMFGLIDLTHGYYIGVGCAVLASILLVIIAPFPRYSTFAVPLEYGIEQDQAFESNRKRVKKTKKVRKKKRR